MNVLGIDRFLTPSHLGDKAFYAPNAQYKEYCEVRGGADDEVAVRISYSLTTLCLTDKLT